MNKELEKANLIYALIGEIKYTWNYYDEDDEEIEIDYKETAQNLLDKGIGDKNQAQMDILKQIEDMMNTTVRSSTSEGYDQVREFIKELKKNILKG